MKHAIRSLTAVGVAALTLAGCGDSGEGGQSGAMPGMNGSESAAEHVAIGTINSIDRAAGTIKISHEPVASAGWPAMTMNFRLADPDGTAELDAGQRIQFRFTTEGGATVTRVAPAE